jgi:hypothetical protein
MATELSEHRGLDSGSAPHHQDAVAKQSQALPKIPLPTSTLLLHSPTSLNVCRDSGVSGISSPNRLGARTAVPSASSMT